MSLYVLDFRCFQIVLMQMGGVVLILFACIACVHSGMDCGNRAGWQSLLGTVQQRRGGTVAAISSFLALMCAYSFILQAL